MADLIPDTTENASEYQVLARKYRPDNFDDLIGHGPMVKTLSNAFSTGRIAHAYVLTGVRGVGKTTTARILARALNYVAADGTDTGPTIDLKEDGLHCRAIAESRHPDVLEMDAASRTGVGDIRELIEGVRYAPVEARYKVYIIDEVHMLSTAAFNALLKTLEEPPPHVKFIFATTEIRKLPVTVLSRCQRFDLKRIDADTLCDHLNEIAGKENVEVEREGLWLIARAAEGSVRDALSILDQALVQRDDDKAVRAETIQSMLGLADRGQVWDLLKDVMSGEAKPALESFRQQYDAGTEPAVVLRDMLEVVHLLTRVKAAGPEAAGHGAAGEADAMRAREMADALAMNSLTRAWTLLMKGLAETQAAPDPAAAAEMALIRIAYASDLPTPDEALRMLKEGKVSQSVGATSGVAPSNASASAPMPPGNHKNNGRHAGGSGNSGGPSGAGGAQAALRAVEPAMDMAASPQAVARPQPSAQRGQQAKLHLESFEEVVKLAGQKKDAKLRVELESYVHLIAFDEGRIEMRLHEKAPTDLTTRLSKHLKEWTGIPWMVTLDDNREGAPSLRDARTAEVMDNPLVIEAFKLFPDAELMAIRDAQPTLDEESAAPIEDEEDDD